MTCGSVLLIWDLFTCFSFCKHSFPFSPVLPSFPFFFFSQWLDHLCLPPPVMSGQCQHISSSLICQRSSVVTHRVDLNAYQTRCISWCCFIPMINATLKHKDLGWTCRNTHIHTHTAAAPRGVMCRDISIGVSASQYQSNLFAVYYTADTQSLYLSVLVKTVQWMFILLKKKSMQRPKEHFLAQPCSRAGVKTRDKTQS